MQYWKDLGFTDVSFDKEGLLTVANTEPAFVKGPHGEELFFNNAGLGGPTQPDTPFQVCYGNGETIEAEVADDVRDAMWKAT